MLNFRTINESPVPETGQAAEAPFVEERISHLRSGNPPPAASETPRHEPEKRAGSANDAELFVGRGVEVKGRISSCQALTIEGRVESAIECDALEILETGTVAGEARVAHGAIRGCFDGTLDVAGCLTVHATGRVSGTIRYREIEVERGGEITGDLAATETEAKPDAAPDPDAQDTLKAAVDSI